MSCAPFFDRPLTLTDLPPLNERDSMFLSAKLLMTWSITLSFESQINWNLSTLTSDIAKWLDDTNDHSTSKVGMLSSPNFSSLAKDAVGPVACSNFQRMLYAQSLAYNQATEPDEEELGILELQHIGAVSGHAFLAELDQKLTPMALANSSHDSLQALFLLIFGTILAVGYSPPIDNSPIFPVEDVSNFS